MTTSTEAPLAEGIAYITLSVSDMTGALAFWRDRFGLVEEARIDGPDAAFAVLCGVAADDIAEQVMLVTPGGNAGRIHLVRFTNPGEPVRLNAAPTDLAPKNLDVTCVDMPVKVAALKEAGFAFRSDIGEYEIHGLQAREVQMPGHDDTNIVFIEVLGGTTVFDVELSQQGYAAVTSFVVVVPDLKREGDFYAEVFGLDELLHHRLEGREIEAIVGLPSGCGLELRMLGTEAQPFGRMELVHYEGVVGENRFLRTGAPATGVLGGGFIVASLEATAEKLAAFGIAASDVVESDWLLGKMKAMRVKTPAGMQLDLIELGH